MKKKKHSKNSDSTPRKKKKVWRPRDIGGRDNEYTELLARRDSRRDRSKPKTAREVRVPARRLEGETRATGLDEIFATNTSNDLHRRTLGKVPGIKPSSIIDGDEFTWEDAQTTIRSPVSAVFMKPKDGRKIEHGHTGAFSRERSRSITHRTKGQANFHDGRRAVIERENSPRSASIKGIEFHLKNTANTSDIERGFDVPMGSYDTSGNDLGDPDADTGPVRRRVRGDRNNLKRKARCLNKSGKKIPFSASDTESSSDENS